jgi:hypothetical protein
MKVKYLKYKQAVAACLEHQNLIGHPFDRDNEAAGTVKHVLLAPYSRILQWHYLSTVFSGVDANKAIAICRDGKYDVVVVSSKYSPGEQDFPPKSLRNYLAEFSVETSVGRPDTAVSEKEKAHK